MRSLIAALRTLVLPYGATSGRRIVLDGVNGTITIYDTSGNKLLTLDGTNGFAVYDTSGNIRTQLALPGGFYSFLELATALASETDAGFVLNQGIGVAPNQSSRLSIGASNLGLDGLRWKIISRQNAATEPIIELDTSQLDASVTGRPILNLVGTDFGGTPLQPRVVIGDLWYGEDAGASVAPTMVQSLPRGVKDSPTWKFEKNADTVLSTTAGTYTSVITTGNIALKAGRLYAIFCKPGAYIISAGAGWAVTDTWRVRLYRSINGGAAATCRSAKAMRTNVAAAAVCTVPDFVGWFSPAANSNVSFIMEAAKTAGAVGVTSTLSVDGGDGYSELTVMDCGAIGAALH